ncbi:hypothetical protein RL2126 [Rhizobium johnstonii 3841]|uniref:Uncharacterized protein n=1 Tax=Rhizobium johnstonii (strain DSM 114642 / LMG 32736 / 3841) TaxID=216596 RepID=Q1MHE5_RHIJ3|nr:hypothetical protein RL2126 [Rhizobium johnstonii 3841]
MALNATRRSPKPTLPAVRHAVTAAAATEPNTSTTSCLKLVDSSVWADIFRNAPGDGILKFVG